MPLVNSVIPSDGSIAEKPLVTEGFPLLMLLFGRWPVFADATPSA